MENNNFTNITLEEPISVKDWLITLIILCVPIANIVMLFVWAFDKTEKKSKSNFCKAYLIMLGVWVAFYMIIVMIILGIFFNFIIRYR